MMQREQLLMVLGRMISSLEDTNIKKWPGQFNYDLTHHDKKIHRLELITKKCSMCIWCDTNNKLGIQFKVGNNVINSHYKLPNVFTRWACPVWRTWNTLSKRVIKAHRQSLDIKAEKEVEEQISVFNDLYYFSFPEEIDNILLDEDDLDD
jgi:hypothetical protein